MSKKSKAQTSAESGAAVLEPDFNLEQWRQVTSGLHLIPLDLVCESADNARETFDQDKLAELAASIRENGGVNKEAAIVRPIPSAEQTVGAVFELISGARRYRALMLNGAKFIKAEVQVPADKTDELVTGFVANFHRVDLNPIEKMRGMLRIMNEKRLATIEALAKALGMQAHTRSLGDLLHLQNLVDVAAEALIDGRITLSHAVLIAREDKEDQPAILKACFRPESVDNGGGMEMVETLISEKKLRDHIRENYRVQTPAPDMFGGSGEGSGERAEEQRQAALEQKADEILEQNGETEQPTQSHEDSKNGEQADGPDESDISDDDLTPEQTSAVKPEAGDDYEKVEVIRMAKLRHLCTAATLETPGILTQIASELASRNRDEARTEKIINLMGWKGADDYASVADLIPKLATHELQRLVIAYAFVTQTFPSYDSGQLEYVLTEVAASKKSGALVANLPASLNDLPAAKKLKTKVKNVNSAKPSKKSETVNLAKAIAANKAKGKKTSAKAKPKAKRR